MRRLIILSLAIVTIGSSETTFAAPNKADTALARQYFVLGRTYYDQGNYDKSLEFFSESYKLSGLTGLLYNMARCNEALGNLQTAIDLYKKFLKDSKKSDPNVGARIRNLERRLGRSQPAGTKTTGTKTTGTKTTGTKTTGTKATGTKTAGTKATGTKATGTKTTGTKTTGTKATGTKATGTKATGTKATGTKATGTKTTGTKTAGTQPPPRTKKDQGGGWMKWTGWTLMGVGVGAVAAGVVLGVLASKKATLLETAYTNGQYDWNEVAYIEEQGTQLNTGGIIALAVGGTLAAAGITLVILAPSKKSKRRATVQPLLGPRVVGVSGGFSF